MLAGITVAVFSSTLGSSFVYDARMQILTGDFIHDWRNWPAVLTGGVLGMDVLDFSRPAMLASLMLDCERRLKSAARGGRKVQRWGWVESIDR